MLSRVIPLEYLKERDVMFWLPPGGQDNDVWADTWVILADLESAHAAAVLALLHDADIGGYVARPSGLKGAPAHGVQLYVDREQIHRATDVVMQFLRGKEQPIMPRAERIAPRIRGRIKAPAVPRSVSVALQIAFMAALIALGMVFAYYRGASMLEHRFHYPAPTSGVPGSANPTWTNPGP
ncbi:hypothetical protein Y900_017110 [Mycolicibacterium aromaticivorans JS19b1 = JCM 16368]|uniref:Uncharacterized protein n=1 Tax=Mycolicibacterium aromaticivorans JS19b1 = JCM 16368 TaxID=1440774 RepID=A0A064CJU5_9MYCO|nr:hypothetical protein [Mycolicibacterium aromaticivorans]KDF00616.1 hypothetical protein Y900_017110 [Mycolicibacterium aromaticivorans JS19b1 = JCM 16368]